MTGMEMREYEDTGGVLPKVRACALCKNRTAYSPQLIFYSILLLTSLHCLAFHPRLYQVCGYTRHDTLYEEARPEDIQNRGKTGPKGVDIGTFLTSINESNETVSVKFPGSGSQLPTQTHAAGLGKTGPRFVEQNSTIGERNRERERGGRQTDTSMSDWLKKSTHTPGIGKYYLFFQCR